MMMMKNNFKDSQYNSRVDSFTQDILIQAYDEEITHSEVNTAQWRVRLWASQ